jgi:HSP20 family molecular chaperone IbpA
MRYRRQSYRYTVVTGHRPLLTVVQVWRREGHAIQFGQGAWRPDADMTESRAAVEVTVDLAGVGEEDFEIQLFEDALIVEGNRELPRSEEGSVYHSAGIKQGAFRLEFLLPRPVDTERVEARYERGLLRVRLPKLVAG